MRCGIVAVVLTCFVSAATGQTSGPKPAAAFSSGNSIVLVSKAGETISTIKLPVGVGEFSFSPDLKELAVVVPHHDKSGGKMYLYSLESRRLQPIPAQSVSPGSAKSEVYSEPQFSSDGTKLFFNTHPQAEGDLYETSGPIAELDLKSLRARAFQWSSGLVTDGFLSSPNGREFLLWDEEKVIEPNGTTLFDLRDFSLDAAFKWALDVAWIGNSCILYQAGKSPNSRVKGEISYFVLQLKSLKSFSAPKIIGLSDKELAGVVSYRYPYAVVKSTTDSVANQRPEYFLISPDGTRTKLTLGDATVARVLPSDLSDDLPTACR
ncbi:MAG: hypothetical protein WBP85_11320 [Terracidiphilus sp.]